MAQSIADSAAARRRPSLARPASREGDRAELACAAQRPRGRRLPLARSPAGGSGNRRGVVWMLSTDIQNCEAQSSDSVFSLQFLVSVYHSGSSARQSSDSCINCAWIIWLRIKTRSYLCFHFSCIMRFICRGVEKHFVDA